MNFTKLAAAAALAVTAIPGAALAKDTGATTTATATAGATVYGNDGMEIGTIESIEGETAILVVEGMKAPVPTAAFGEGENGATLNATKAQIVGMLQAAKEQADAARDAALVVGADVATVKGMPIGAVKSVEGDNIVVSHGGSAVALTRNQFAVVDGTLVALVAMADIMAAMEAQGGSGMMATEGGQ